MNTSNHIFRKLIILVLVCIPIVSFCADEVSLEIHLTEAGTLAAQVSEDVAETVQTLTVYGPIDDTDFETMKKWCIIYGLETVNLANADVKDKRLPKYAFADPYYAWVVKIKNLILPDDIEEIGPLAFWWSCLESINLPKSLKRLSLGSFSHTKLKGTIQIPDGIEVIPRECFASNWGITEFIIPNSVRRIERQALEMTGINEINLPDSLEYIGDLGLYCNRNLLKIEVPESCLELGEAVFCACEHLEEVILPSAIKKIPPSCFDCCVSMKSLTIPSSVEVMGEMSLLYMPELRTLNVMAENPPVFLMEGDDEVYNLQDTRNATLYVPKGAAVKYREAPIWRLFDTIEEMEDSNNLTITVNHEEKIEYFDMKGRRVLKPSSGLYLWRKGAESGKVTFP